MSKFKVGDIVIQVHGGYNTAPEDNGKKAKVIRIGGSFISNHDGISIISIDHYIHNVTGWRGEDAFELYSREVKQYGIVKFLKDLRKEAKMN